jgi:hypothetical protein
MVTFSLSGSYKPFPGEVFNIIQNTNSGKAVKDDGIFSGLAQGGKVPFNSVALVADYHKNVTVT